MRLYLRAELNFPVKMGGRHIEEGRMEINIELGGLKNTFEHRNLVSDLCTALKTGLRTSMEELPSEHPSEEEEPAPGHPDNPTGQGGAAAATAGDDQIF